MTESVISEFLYGPYDLFHILIIYRFEKRIV